MSDETEPIEQDEETAAAEKVLTEAGDEAGVWKMRAERAQRALKKERETRRTIELQSVRERILKDPAYEYADPDLVSGKSEDELRASALRAHSAVARVIAARGLTAAPKTEEQTEAERLAKLSTDFGKPPPVATEAVTGEAPMDYSDMIARNRDGKMSREEILRDLRENGAVRIARKQSSAAIRGRGEPAPTV
jgi:hypothetical protein